MKRKINLQSKTRGIRKFEGTIKYSNNNNSNNGNSSLQKRGNKKPGAVINGWITLLTMLLILIKNFFGSFLAERRYTFCHNFFDNKLQFTTIEDSNLSKQTRKMPNNKKRMSFGSNKKATNKVKKTKLDATLMETKMLPRAKEDHSKDKDKEEKNWKVYELSVKQSSGSKSYVEEITKKVNIDNPRMIFMAEAAVDNQFKLDQAKVTCIDAYCKVGVNHAKSVIVFDVKDEHAFNKLLDWWQGKSQKWGIQAARGKFSNTVMLCTTKAIEKEFYNLMKGEDKKSKKYLWDVIEHSGLAEKSEEHEGKYTLTEVYRDTLDEYFSPSFNGDGWTVIQYLCPAGQPLNGNKEGKERWDNSLKTRITLSDTNGKTLLMQKDGVSSADASVLYNTM